MDNSKKSVIKIVKMKKTKKKTRKNTNNSETDIDFDEKLEKLKNDLIENYACQKRLMSEIEDLLKSNKKVYNNARIAKSISEFDNIEPVPERVKKLFKTDDALSRSEVLILFYKYFTDNKMYDKTTKKEIIPDKKIVKLFNLGPNDKLTFFNLQSEINKLYE